jgi:hypothetical protein
VLGCATLIKRLKFSLKAYRVLTLGKHVFTGGSGSPAVIALGKSFSSKWQRTASRTRSLSSGRVEVGAGAGEGPGPSYLTSPPDR